MIRVQLFHQTGFKNCVLILNGLGDISQQLTDIKSYAFFWTVQNIYQKCTAFSSHSRYLVRWEIRASTTEAEVEIILQRMRTLSNSRPAPLGSFLALTRDQIDRVLPQPGGQALVLFPPGRFLIAIPPPPTILDDRSHFSVGFR